METLQFILREIGFGILVGLGGWEVSGGGAGWPTGWMPVWQGSRGFFTPVFLIEWAAVIISKEQRTLLYNGLYIKNGSPVVYFHQIFKGDHNSISMERISQIK